MFLYIRGSNRDIACSLSHHDARVDTEVSRTIPLVVLKDTYIQHIVSTLQGIK